ncbi:MAG: beta-lactamase domain protein, partial [Acidimicrobiia bacterium]|nr:beta-lactamase domain protein [Acidimicrobiia bacterium]
ASEVLPAHEHRVVGQAQRVEPLHLHHQQRFAEVVAGIRDGPDTAWEVAARMKWSRSWDSIEGFMRRAAVGEAMAHMLALADLGVLTEVVDHDVSHFRLTDQAAEVVG